MNYLDLLKHNMPVNQMNLTYQYSIYVIIIK
ncbi:hypothetical protein XFF6991_4905 [Xanthomonas phaseoli pv. phaseoli]|uniref:Uncharacterized protein n=1 Tax=Xanthomonas campestris pv. phaseoli TaxID=317013 RepID=A0A7Z7NFX7_XANCH|nr:hypothetical protein XFF6991_4905 [Xanthomonas phaseoli pv. phaseoli]